MKKVLQYSFVPRRTYLSILEINGTKSQMIRSSIMNLNNLLTNSKRILRLKDVQTLTGLSRTMIYDLQSKGDFPQSIKLVQSGRAMGWQYSDVIDWIDSRVQA